MKTFKGLSAIALLGAVITGCNHLEIQPEEENLQTLEINKITAYNGDASTKTVLADDRTSILWKPNDQIKVFYGSASAQFTSMNTEPEECTIFSSNTSLVYGGTESSSAYIWAVYPYSNNSTHDKTTVSLTVPNSTNSVVAGSFANGSFPAIGRSKDTNIAFYNVCGGICFTVTNENVRSVSITGNNNEDIAGTVKVGFDENERPVVTEVIAGQKTITVGSTYNNTPFQVGTWYYIPMLPVNFTNGFTMRFSKAYNYSGTESALLVTNTPYEVRRSIFGQVENADNNLTYRVRVNSINFGNAKAYVEPLSTVQLTYTLSPSAATYDSIAWTSSDENIATVNQSGLVTGVSCGTCTITLTIDNVSASCTIYVSSPAVTTQDASTISYGSAVLNGSLSAPGIDGLSPTRAFRYSKTSSTVEALISSGTNITASSVDGQNYSASVTGLEPNTTYYYVADCYYYNYYSTNHYHHYYGTVKSFTTSAIPDLADGVIDLGLSVKWSATNIGADSPEEIGDRFAWGEVETKSSYGYSNYQWGYSTPANDDYDDPWSYISKYGSSYSPPDDYEGWVNDGKTVLDAEDDVARVEWRGKWRMPTQTECQELIDNCSFELVMYNGQRGYLVTSNKTGYTNKRIFLPDLSGSFYVWDAQGGNNYVYGVCFWSASQFLPYPFGAYAYTRNGLQPVDRTQGLPVRPVKGE